MMGREQVKQIVIAGNGGAAAHAVRSIRLAGFDGALHLVSDTEEAAFNPMLAPYYLKGMLSWKHCFPYGRDFYQNHDVQCHLGTPVERIDAENKVVHTGSGGILHYDKCLVATGARVSIPPIPGLDNPDFAFPLRTSKSTLSMEKAMAKARKVLVLGASLVGVKVAEILTKRHIDVILMDAAPQMLPRGAHPEAAALLRTFFESHGIDVRLGCSIEGIEGSEEGVCCFFPEAVMEEADFVAVCTGIRPNSQFLDPDQVAMDLAVLVDRQMQTSAPDLYAAGDVCQGPSLLTGRQEWLGTWANACYQGRTAGSNMAQAPCAYPGGVPQHISPLFDWTYAQIGDINPTGDHVETRIEGHPEEEGGYKLSVYADGVLTGVNLINRMQELSALKQELVYKKEWPLKPHF